MTKFEQMLLDVGYEKYVYNWKTHKYEKTDKHTISTMVNLYHVYFHKSDINQEKGIVFGLSERDKPSTLISPRPRILVYRDKNGCTLIEDEMFDDSINIALKEIAHEKILEAMFDKSIIFKFDLSNSSPK
jgi:hypothetical protein